MDRFIIDYNQLKTFDRELIQLYHQEANKRIDDLKEIESLITDRAYRLFSVYYAVEIAVIGYVFTQLDDTRNMGLINASMAIVVFTAISLYYAVKVMRPHDVMPAGRSPRNFKIDKKYDYFKENNFTDKYAYTMAGELMNLQYKIDSQNEKNIARIKLNNASINFMLVGLILAILFFVLTVIFE
ncbi:hypothetical protein VVD37_15735 [Bacteroides fragilis]|nr:hypothetical protein [Bacteroides fragilis]EXY18194.1 hypothetical protein M077_2312 [Bacteroides fragilis str. 2-F-2 \